MKKSIKIIEILAATTAVLLLTFFIANNPSITGYATTEILTQKLDFETSESKLVGIESLSYKPIKLTSLMISGEIIGDGLVELYLINNKEKKLIYSNLQKKKSGFSKITGQVTGAIRLYEKADLRGELIVPETYITKAEKFNNVCIETCHLKNLDKNLYEIEIWLQPGTKVRLTELKYSIIE
jgi:hypothetical protein